MSGTSPLACAISPARNSDLEAAGAGRERPFPTRSITPAVFESGEQPWFLPAPRVGWVIKEAIMRPHDAVVLDVPLPRIVRAGGSYG
jgi:hypothetical protein